MRHLALIVCTVLLAQALAFADDKPQTFTGTIGKAGDTDKIAAIIGNDGVLFIRSQERWDAINKLMPDLKPDKPLPQFDFTKQSVVLLYACLADRDDKLSLDQVDLGANPPKLGFWLNYFTGVRDKTPLPVNQFILAVIPVASKVQVVLRSMPQNAVMDRPVPPPLFSATLGGKAGGDIVDGLQAAIEAKADTVKPGDDIKINFELHLADPGDAKPEQFGKTPKSVFVWDAIASLGYRNHAFFVTTPDGKTTLLRPKEHGFRRNVPNPVEITKDKPYALPASTAQSLKELGVDTTAAGKYTITGLYEETGGEQDTTNGKKQHFWGGSIASNTITVEVK